MPNPQAEATSSPHTNASPDRRDATPTEEQANAIQQLLDFIADPDPGSNFFVLGGFAGTGKTFCMREVLKRTRGSRASSSAFTCAH